MNGPAALLKSSIGKPKGLDRRPRREVRGFGPSSKLKQRSERDDGVQRVHHQAIFLFEEGLTDREAALRELGTLWTTLATQCLVPNVPIVSIQMTPRREGSVNSTRLHLGLVSREDDGIDITRSYGEGIQSML